MEKENSRAHQLRHTLINWGREINLRGKQNPFLKYFWSRPDGERTTGVRFWFGCFIYPNLVSLLTIMLPFEKSSASNFFSYNSFFSNYFLQPFEFAFKEANLRMLVLSLAQMYLVQQQDPKSGEEELAGRASESSDEIQGPKLWSVTV